jgi:putative tryptophan/tyrosine transport system substrate-binding protein
MKRREFIIGIGWAAAGWPIVARSQQPAASVIGLLHGGSSEAFKPMAAALGQGLNEGGFIEGRNLVIEARWARGQFDRLPVLAADLVAHRPAVIATGTLPGALAAKAATTTIPVVFIIGEDPVKAGLVTSLNQPGGNVTGMSNFMNVLGAKRLELVSEAVPRDVVLALLVNPNNPNADPDTRSLQAAANALGRFLEVLKASSEGEIETAFSAAVERKVGAMFINIDPFFFSGRSQILALAARHRLPTIYPFREMVVEGGLMSYGASFPNAWRQAGIYVARILKGAKPAALPVVQPTNLELAINLKTAKAIGLTFPPTLLARADEVIE